MLGARRWALAPILIEFLLVCTTMSSGKSKARSKVDALNASLDELENKLEPLFARPLSDTLSSLETVQQAKLYAVLPYLINDLIFGASMVVSFR